MKHRISRRAFLRGCTLLAASAAVGSLTSCDETNAKDSSLPQLIVGSDTYPPYIYLNNDGIPAAVSYTHLDVYKRQDQDSVVNNTPDTITTVTEELSQEDCAMPVSYTHLVIMRLDYERQCKKWRTYRSDLLYFTLSLYTKTRIRRYAVC